MKSNVGHVFISEALNELPPKLFNLRSVAEGFIIGAASELLYGGGDAIVGEARVRVCELDDFMLLH